MMCRHLSSAALRSTDDASNALLRLVTAGHPDVKAPALAVLHGLLRDDGGGKLCAALT
jgi:hypothetical protein